MHNKRALEILSREVYMLVAKARAAGASPGTIKGLMALSSKLLKDSAKSQRKGG